MKLAIKGHETRGKEVIRLLEILGGNNYLRYCGYIANVNAIYYVDSSDRNFIKMIENPSNISDFIVFTLEEFLEKFPYKVGDKVKAWINGYCSICNIRDMEWDSIVNEIKYKIQDYWYSTMNLQPYKEEDMEGVYAYNEINCYHQDFGDKVRIRLGNDFEIKVEDNITYIVKKQPQYPKDYVECCECLKHNPFINNVSGYKRDTIEALQTLITCRDAYWKLAGKQLGLDKPWKPDWDNLSATHEFIKIYKGCFIYSSRVLVFPTEEMRDAFYDNFKNLIEQCKELL